MAKEPFTPTGVADKLTALYALSDPALEAEAVAIETDIKDWIGDNFNLTGAQTGYLAGLNSDFMDEMGAECALCFRNKLDIELVYPAPPAPGMIKWSCPEDRPKKKANGSGGVDVSGKLVIEMHYT